MKILAFGSLALVLSISIAGCGGGDPLTRIEASYDRSLNAGCTACDASAEATAACLAEAEMTNPFTGPSWDCQRAAYMRYPNELNAFYSCQANAVQSYESCLSAAIASCPPSGAAITACSDTLGTSAGACPRPTSTEALAAVGACFTDG